MSGRTKAPVQRGSQCPRRTRAARVTQCFERRRGGLGVVDKTTPIYGLVVQDERDSNAKSFAGGQVIHRVGSVGRPGKPRRDAPVLRSRAALCEAQQGRGSVSASQRAGRRLWKNKRESAFIPRHAAHAIGILTDTAEDRTALHDGGRRTHARHWRIQMVIVGTHRAPRGESNRDSYIAVRSVGFEVVGSVSGRSLFNNRVRDQPEGAMSSASGQQGLRSMVGIG